MRKPTFKDFLSEEDKTAEIQKRCALFLEKSKGWPLYRGYGGRITALFSGSQEVPIRKDRRPRDSSQFVHGLMDAYFTRKFGVNVRSEGLFATGNFQTAKKYGTPYYTFPVGNFKFVWGTYQGDPVEDTLHWTRKIADMMAVRSEKESDNVTDSVLNEIDWHTDDFVTAIKSGAEIAILADSAIIVPVGKKTYGEIIGRV